MHKNITLPISYLENKIYKNTNYLIYIITKYKKGEKRKRKKIFDLNSLIKKLLALLHYSEFPENQ